jgi:pSer/pThr/pTyr-binding forkhead associated (FHA) protein
MSEALKLKTQIEIKLVIQRGPHAGQRFSFSKKEITIGRAPENDVVLLNDPLISRQHAKVIVVGQDVEVVNLSQKNSILVSGENVQKWKLVNSGTFTVGDTEFQIQFDLGQSVVPIKPKTNLQVVPAKPVQKPVASQIVQKAPQALQQQQMQIQQQKMQQQKLMQQQQIQFQHQQRAGQVAAGPSAAAKNPLSNPKIRFYLIVAIAAAAAAYFYLGTGSDKVKKVEDKKTVLRYSDEVTNKLNSKSEKEEQKKIEKLYEQKNSPTTLRAQENFIKGMRDFQLGDYNRAQEFFQVVLNLQPGHELAKRHLYLSKVRFDEVLKAKLMLGESNYQKHNFKMCQSLYQQVLNMLQGKSSDQNFQLATAMNKKCELAAEGVR